MSLISCENVSFGYEGKAVISQLNFKVDSGDYLCIVGENGAGKSTLMKGLLHLKQSIEGTITFDKELKGNEIGYLPQQTIVQKDFPASVYEIVLSGRLSSRGLLPFYSKKDKQIVEENLHRLGIAHLKNKCYRELSGGQQQRVLLARALCATKKLLLLDEPVSGLDPVVTKELYELIATINKETGLTIIVISHDIQNVIAYATKILHVKNEQRFFGTTKEYEASFVGKEFLLKHEQDWKGGK